MMFDDEELPKKQTPVPKKLDGLAIAELREYIQWLTSEIARAEAMIKHKEAAHKAAEGFFKN